jgi:beta-N-acetylhexosaminidase
MSAAERERLAARCLLASFQGPVPPDWIRRALADGLGGVVLFASNVEDRSQLAALTATLRADSEPLIAIDEEGGDVTRLDWLNGSRYPGNAALGVVDDVTLTERVAASIGSELAAVGVNLNFAPVADVSSNSANPIIGVRAFGSDPELVARHVAAFVEGQQSRGVAACAKHFPGHGSTTEDSHLVLPTISGDDLDDALSPFFAAVRAGVAAVMTAHIRIASLDDAPATLSPVVLGLLREELGFQGVIVSDACEMKGFIEVAGLEEGAARALRAGCDALIVGRDLGEEATGRVRRALVEHVPEARLREAATRVQELVSRAQPGPGEPDLEAATIAAERALRVDGAVTLEPGSQIVQLRAAENIAAGRVRHGFPSAVVVAEGESIPERPDAIVVQDAHRHAWMRDAVDANPGAVVVEIGLPLWRPEHARGYVATYGAARVNLDQAAAHMLPAAVAR